MPNNPVTNAQETVHSPTRACRDRAVVDDELAQACVADLLDAFGVANLGRYGAQWALRRIFAARLRQLTRRMRVYDRIVGAHGLGRGGAYATRFLALQTHAHGRHNVPTRGPVLIVSNHPGVGDSLALFAACPRSDLSVIAARRALLAALPATARHLAFVAGDGAHSSMLMRGALRHLRCGRTLLTYPAGRIEPDPATRPSAVDSLDDWSRCIDFLARHVPGLAIVPAVVGGVLSDAALSHPLVRLRREPSDRAWLAATLQMLGSAASTNTIRLVFGEPIRATPDACECSLHVRVVSDMRRLLTDMNATSAKRGVIRKTPGLQTR